MFIWLIDSELPLFCLQEELPVEKPEAEAAAVRGSGAELNLMLFRCATHFRSEPGTKRLIG